MAIINGPRLIQGVLQELGVTTLSPLVQGALGARLQQAIEAGSASNFQLAAVLASNPTINAATPAGQSPGAFVDSHKCPGRLQPGAGQQRAGQPRFRLW